MNYTQARSYLDEVAQYRSVLGLENMRALLAELGNPQDELKFIHISGTNGKGSALAYLSTILQEAGYRVGRYISPTLFSYRERIQVNEEYIAQEALARHVTTISRAMERMRRAGAGRPTIFEVETAVAFLYFLEKQCDIVVLETGMGGDTDATNVVRTSVLEVLMPISMDHMEFLGNTLAEIAWHKAGIIKPGTTVVSAPQQEEALAVIRQKVKTENARLFLTERAAVKNIAYGIREQRFSYRNFADLKIRLAGTYQIENAATAVEAVCALQTIGYSITEEQMRAGLWHTQWKGRFSVILEEPLFIIDGAHNRAGAQRLRESMTACLGEGRIFAICGVFRDKEYEEVLRLTGPGITSMITIQTPANPRALPAEELAQTAQKYIKDVRPCASIEEAVAQSLELASGQNDVILAFGSLSFLGAIVDAVEKRKRSL